MAYDEGLEVRIEEALAGREVTKKQMFGGLCFLDRGNMLCGIVKDGRLMLRVGKEAYESVLARPQVVKMDFTGKPMTGLVYIEPAGFEEDRDLKAWLELGLAFTGSLPDK
ncbi:MAG: hypothetical protein A2600_07460 [Candidatus Lambdaproteobacteria bacterium RIFOXYD1_FULL_56_27]|uniref:TfoX N-terminal domain-containing protein n=1 Tax=Candidatus Lambdaproteobacteria bacterium RIFOXYD2_FULL_56_26 TaxID=1817773 RepID=A0A1F6GV91_9PROT|nr:MAG: hypothetical protein A2557_05285 [Candidatus Lambdaproteobacteria bacterium RIFOXYD2_FULL_56_26]OGH03766.1 MAG: hypothetical protein A2426_00910 [Candidatus Lambdaproteobacteria bacterium RIFOXYC1_FULL_56_13]OGH07350.1 MAG: hypothetical protein A2600_07460 [Candidatus Lambdaproteobacteria bacterium RIFOXYD1_FULL_56_27]